MEFYNSSSVSASSNKTGFLRELLDGLPTLNFIRKGSDNSTSHTSGHSPVKICKKMDFTVLDEYKSGSGWDKEKKHLGKHSSLLSDGDIGELHQLVYASQAQSNHYLMCLFKDLRALLRNDIDMDILSECSLTNEVGSGTHREDFWVVRANGRPLFPILGKAPLSDNIVCHAPKKSKLEVTFKKKRRSVVHGPDNGVAEESQAPPEDEEESDQEEECQVETGEHGEIISDSQSDESLDDTGKLANARLLGQGLDYVKYFQQFHGITEVFGLLTTMKHFRIIGLPGCEQLARAVDVTASRPVIAQKVLSSRTRTVVASPIYRHDDPNLVRLLLSLIKKAAYAQSLGSLPLLSTLRHYIVLSDSMWWWMRPKTELVNSWKSSLTFLPREALPSMGGSFVVLRPLHLKAHAKVWLCLVKTPAANPSVGSICVVKQVDSDEVAQLECHLWQSVNQVTSVSVHTVCRMRALVTPFVILAQTVTVANDVTVFFDFDPLHWLFQDYAPLHNPELPPVCGLFAEAMKHLARAKGLLNVSVAAAQAVEKMAAQGFVHFDLEWRHVALIPDYDEGTSEITGVHAGLIDFESAAEPESPDVDTEALALQLMRNRLDELKSMNCTFLE